MKLCKFLGLVMLAFAMFAISCSGEDGTNGTDGINGVDGTNGTNGQDGADGEKGEGFDELTEKGSITTIFEGTRPDNIAFKDSTTFRFAPVGAFSSKVTITEAGEDTEYDFRIRRFLSTPEGVFQENYVFFEIVVNNIGEDSEEITFANLGVIQYAIVGDDDKFFVIEDEFERGAAGITEFEFSDMEFNAETNNLSFSYTLTIEGDANDSNNLLNISGSADVDLSEEIVAE